MTATDFADVLRDFAQAVQRGDGHALAALFTPDGVYDDGFYGPRSGADGIRSMLADFHAAARDFRWDFLDPVCDGDTGYARYRFAYTSTLPDAAGTPVVFDGMAQFTFRDGRIARYCEVFDRGVALVQLGFVPERISRTLRRYVPR